MVTALVLNMDIHVAKVMTIQDKTFDQKKLKSTKYRQEQTFLIIISRAEAGDQFVSSRNIKSFLIFLIYQDLQFSVICKLVRQLIYKIYYTRHQFPFYLCQIKSILKLSKWPKYCEQDYMKDFISTFSNDSYF